MLWLKTAEKWILWLNARWMVSHSGSAFAVWTSFRSYQWLWFGFFSFRNRMALYKSKIITWLPPLFPETWISWEFKIGRWSRGAKKTKVGKSWSGKIGSFPAVVDVIILPSLGDGVSFVFCEANNLPQKVEEFVPSGEWRLCNYHYCCCSCQRRHANFCCLFVLRRSWVIRMLVFCRLTFSALHLIYGWQMTTLWVHCLPWIIQLGQLSIPSFWGQ